MATAEATAVAEKETTTVGSKPKAQKTGNLILDIATEVESLSKTKALNLADKLAETIETSYFELGGVLKVINDNSWFEGYADLDAFVQEKYGFQGRKARYLISIYDHLVTKQIPWDKVQPLGWTKLKDLAAHLTPENVDEWVEKAKNLTVVELQALLKAGEPSGEGEKTAKTTDDIVKMTFKLKQDQSEIVQQALAKAKGELQTEYDSVALENIAAGYVGGNTGLAQKSLVQHILALNEVRQAAFEAAITQIADEFKEFDINVGPAAQPEGEAAQA